MFSLMFLTRDLAESEKKSMNREYGFIVYTYTVAIFITRSFREKSTASKTVSHSEAEGNFLVGLSGNVTLSNIFDLKSVFKGGKD